MSFYIDLDDYEQVSGSGGASKLSELTIDTDLEMGNHNVIIGGGELIGSLNESISLRVQQKDISLLNEEHTQINPDLYSTTGGTIKLSEIEIDSNLNMKSYNVILNSGSLLGNLSSTVTLNNIALMNSSFNKINPDLYDSSGGLPSGLEFDNGILTINGTQRGLVIPDVLRIDNRSLAQGGTNYNMLLENYNAEYQIADQPTPPTPTISILLESDGKVIQEEGLAYPTYTEVDVPEVRYTTMNSTRLILVQISSTYTKDYTLSEIVKFACEGITYDLKEIRYVENMAHGFPIVPASVEKIFESFNNCPNLGTMDLSKCTNLNLEEVDSEGIRTLTHCFVGTTVGTLLLTESQKLKINSLLEQDSEQNWVFKHNNNVKIEVITNE